MKRYICYLISFVIIALFAERTASASAPSIVFNKSEVLRPTKSLFYPSVNNIKTADFTGNGILDVVYTIGSELGICLNHGGKLQPPIIIDAYKYSHEMVIADLTGNGHPDIAYTVPGPPHNLFAGAVHYLANNGNLTFDVRVVDSEFLQPFTISAADFNGDGFMDLVVAGIVPYGLAYLELAWYENDGAGHFTKHRIDIICQGANQVDVGDINGDGTIDILYIGDSHYNTSWYENDGTGQFTRHLLDVPHGFTKRGILQDMNQNGYPDILLSVGNPNGLILLVNEDGGTTFTEQYICNTEFHYNCPLPVDLDGDGDLDLLCSVQPSDGYKLLWYENDGYLNFTKHLIEVTDVGKSEYSVLDITGNGYGDIIAGDVFGGLAWWESQPHVGIGLSMPSHHFTPGDACGLTASIYSHHPDYSGRLPLFLLLEAGGHYWFYPSWSPEITWSIAAVAPGSRDIPIIDPFHWPSGVGAASGIHFISLFAKPDLSNLMGVINIFEFGWSP